LCSAFVGDANSSIPIITVSFSMTSPFKPSLVSRTSSDGPRLPVISAIDGEKHCQGDIVLELSDGFACQGISFGVEGKSVAGECVFQTGQFT
jgi:hypothetical protein